MDSSADRALVDVIQASGGLLGFLKNQVIPQVFSKRLS